MEGRMFERSRAHSGGVTGCQLPIAGSEAFNET
jgi:hypothetical protein